MGVFVGFSVGVGVFVDNGVGVGVGVAIAVGVEAGVGVVGVPVYSYAPISGAAPRERPRMSCAGAPAGSPVSMQGEPGFSAKPSSLVRQRPSGPDGLAASTNTRISTNFRR